MKQYDLNDLRVKITHGFLKNVLEKSDAKALPEYFSESGILIINEKELRGIQAK